MIQQLHRIFFLGLAGWAILPLHVHNYWGFMLLVIGVMRGYAHLRPRLSVHWILALPAILAVTGYVLNPDLSTRASVTLGHSLHLAFMPLGLLLYRAQSDRWSSDSLGFFRVYVGAVFAAFVYFNWRIITGWGWENPAFGSLQTHDLQTIYRNHFIAFSGHHPTYFSYLGWFALALMLWVPNVVSNSILRWTAIVGIFAGTAVLGSRMPFLAALLAFLAVRGVDWWKIPRFRLGLLFFALLGFGFMYPRWEELKALVNGADLNSASIRVQLWSCWWHEWVQRPWWGWGTGASLDQLQVCFEARGFSTAFDQHLNPHNQYAQWLLDWGVAGTVALGATAFLLWRKYGPKVHDLMRFFLIFTAISALTESLLNRQLGIVFVGLWFSFLVLYSNSANEERL